MARSLHLNANIIATGRHAAAWRLPGSEISSVELDHFVNIARLAERGKFDAIFVADYPGLHDQASHRPFHSLDPLLLMSAIAAKTTHIGLIATASTTFEHPYAVARRFASLDHISHGRASWNVVTSYQEGMAPSFGIKNLPTAEERYRRAQEFIEIVFSLWDGWSNTATVADKSTGVYVDFEQVKATEYEGEFFSVHGRLNVPRPPQGRPVVVQAGDSTASRKFGARWGDALFTVQRSLTAAQQFYQEVKGYAESYGRDPDQLVVLPGLYTVVGSTEAEARARKRAMDDLLDIGEEHEKLARHLGVPLEKIPLDERLRADIFDGRTTAATGFVENIIREGLEQRLTVREIIGRNPFGGQRLIVGSPEQIADEIEHWFQNGAADGFNLNMDAYPAGLELFVEHVVPELQRRKIYRQDYSGATMRDHFGLKKPS